MMWIEVPRPLPWDFNTDGVESIVEKEVPEGAQIWRSDSWAWKTWGHQKRNDTSGVYEDMHL